jgi:hypothetical protein
MMPGGRNKQDKLYQEWSRHSGLPEDAIPHPEPEARTENGRTFPPGNIAGRGMPNALAGLGVGRLPDSLLIIILLGLSVVLSIVNMMMLVIVLLKL